MDKEDKTRILILEIEQIINEFEISQRRINDILTMKIEMLKKVRFNYLYKTEK